MQLRRHASADRVEQNMTPMIDVVFQLLTFFVMSFKIASQEGDFDIRMPLAASGPTEFQDLRIRVRMLADANGGLHSMVVGDRDLGTGPAAFATLHRDVRNLIGVDIGPGSMASQMEVELDCEPGLNYEHVVHAISAVSGYIDQHGHTVKLIEKIKFSPPK